MLSIFSIPKPFQGRDKEIQEKALESWLSIHPDCEIILLGNEAGIVETAEKYGVKSVESIKRSEYGTPLLDNAFELAAEHASNDLLCYVNADIVLLEDLYQAASKISFDEFLGVSQRFSLESEDISELLSDNTYDKIEKHVRSNYKPDPVFAIDLFLFRKTTDFEMPPFIVGRPRWDNWLIFRARKMGLPVIDLTASVLLLHQKHEYDHVPLATGKKWAGPEADLNEEIASRYPKLFNILHSNYKLTKNGLVYVNRLKRPINAWKTEMSALYPKWKFLFTLISNSVLFLRRLIKN